MFTGCDQWGLNNGKDTTVIFIILVTSVNDRELNRFHLSITKLVPVTSRACSQTGSAVRKKVFNNFTFNLCCVLWNVVVAPSCVSRFSTHPACRFSSCLLITDWYAFIGGGIPLRICVTTNASSRSGRIVTNTHVEKLFYKNTVRHPRYFIGFRKRRPIIT